MTLEDRLDRVRAEYLRRMTQGDIGLLRQVEQYTTMRNGKMLRPRILLAAAASLGPEQLDSQRTLLLAVAVEMLHNASLLHDDVVDHADRRRNRPSVNSRWSNAVAVLVGDWFLTQIMLLLDEAGDADASRLINQTVQAMVQAELLAQEHPEPDAATYLRIIDGKTASLFATAAQLGNPVYRDFGLHYGRLFQLRDDLSDGDGTPWTTALIEQEERAINQLDKVLNI